MKPMVPPGKPGKVPKPERWSGGESLAKLAKEEP